MSELALIPLAGTNLVATRDERGIWLSLRRACEAIGIDVESQRKRLKEAAWAVTVEITATGPDGKAYRMTGLHIDSVPMWLATIHSGKVAPEAVAVLVEYQLKAARVLRDHFLPERAEIAPAFDPADPRIRIAVMRSLEADVAKLEATVEAQTQVIAELAPKAEVHDEVMAAGDTLGFREACKVVRRSVDVTEQDIAALMFARGWVQRIGKDDKLLPAYYGEEHGYVTARLRPFRDRKSGEPRSKPELRVTNKGVDRLVVLLRKAAAA